MKTIAWIAATLLLLASLLLTLPFSSVGTRMLVQGINQSGLLRIEYGSGALFGDLELDQVSLQLDALDLRLEGIDTRLDIDCFWRSAFCFQRLSVRSLYLDIGVGDDDSVAAAPAAIDIPYAYEAPSLEIASVQVTWPGGSWQQQALSADLQLVNSVLEVASARIQSPRLSIDGSENPQDAYPGFEPPSLFMPLGLAFENLVVSSAELQVAGSRQRLDELSLTATWSGYDLDLEHMAVATAEIGQATAHGTLGFSENWQLSVDASAQLVATGNDWLDRHELALSVQGDLQQLLLELVVAGEPDVSVEVDANVIAPGLPFTGSASALWPDETSLAEIMGTQGQMAQLALRGPLGGRFEGNLQSQQFQLSVAANGLGYEQLRLQASGSLNGNELELRKVELSDELSASQIAASGQLRWGQGWSFEGDISSPGVALPAVVGPSPGNLQGALNLRLDGSEDDWELRWRQLDLAGDYRGMPALARGEGGVNASLQLLPGTTQISANGAELNVQAQAGGGSTRLEFQLDDLGRWVAGAQGRLQLAGQGKLAGEQLELRGSAEDVQMQGVELGRVNLHLSYDGAQERVAASVMVPDVSSTGYRLRNVALDLSGTFADHQLRLSSAGDIAGLLVVPGSWSSGEWTASLQPTKLATSSGDWTLDKAVSLQWFSDASRLSVAGHCWQHSEFRLCAEPAVFGDSGNLNLDLAGDVRAINGLLPRGLRVRGRLDASLDMAWAPGQRVQLDAAVKARDMRTIRLYGMGERVSVDWQAIDISLNRQDDERLAISGSIVRNNQQVLSLEGLLPATRDGNMSGRVDLKELKLSVLSPWVTQLSELGGSLSGELILSGTPANPIAQGDLRLRDGRMVGVANPTVLSELALDIAIRGKQAELAGTASLGDGPLSLAGNISSEPELRVELSVSGERHQLLLPPASEVLVSEELTLVVTENLLDVRGEVRVLEGVLRHEELPTGSVGVSREVIVVDTLGNAINNERSIDLSADIWLRIRDRFQVEGEGLRATLGGDLHVVALPGEDPQVFGNLNLVGGELEAYRQRLQIRSGTIAFSGPIGNPALDVVAERDIRAENITVGARLSGQLDEPVLEVYSDPVMSQGEAMSYLVRGRGLDAGAGADGTALALSMGASVVNRSGIVDELNRLPLINDVAFGASGAEDETAATVSGYIGSRLYLSFGRGLYQPINVLTARLYLQSRLWLEVVSELENSADLYYSFDID